MEKPFQSPRIMLGKGKINKELSSLSKGLHIGKGYDGEDEVPHNFGATLGTC